MAWRVVDIARILATRSPVANDADFLIEAFFAELGRNPKFLIGHTAYVFIKAFNLHDHEEFKFILNYLKPQDFIPESKCLVSAFSRIKPLRMSVNAYTSKNLAQTEFGRYLKLLMKSSLPVVAKLELANQALVKSFDEFSIAPIDLNPYFVESNYVGAYYVVIYNAILVGNTQLVELAKSQVLNILKEQRFLHHLPDFVEHFYYIFSPEQKLELRHQWFLNLCYWGGGHFKRGKLGNDKLKSLELYLQYFGNEIAFPFEESIINQFISSEISEVTFSQYLTDIELDHWDSRGVSSFQRIKENLIYDSIPALYKHPSYSVSLFTQVLAQFSSPNPSNLLSKIIFFTNYLTFVNTLNPVLLIKFKEKIEAMLQANYAAFEAYLGLPEYEDLSIPGLYRYIVFAKQFSLTKPPQKLIDIVISVLQAKKDLVNEEAYHLKHFLNFSADTAPGFRNYGFKAL